jgi:hypothetical protein
MKGIPGSCSKAREKPEHVKLKKYRYEEKDLENQDGLGSAIGQWTNQLFEFIK